MWGFIIKFPLEKYTVVKLLTTHQILDFTLPNQNNFLTPTSLEDQINDTGKNEWDIDYITLNNNINKPLPSPPQPPKSYFPLPTTSDYEYGEIFRFFIKKINSPIFIEIEEKYYFKILNKQAETPYQLYTPFSIPWEVSGDRNKVYNTNKNTVERIEKQQQLWGLKSYFKDRYTQFYK